MRTLSAAPASLRVLQHESAGRVFLRPTSFAELFGYHLAQFPRATLIAGGTDLMVYANQRYERFECLIALDALPELRRFECTPREITIGAGLALTHVEALLEHHCPSDARSARVQLWPLFSSRLIRNRATLGGNLGTASPIGDSPPVWLALDAQLALVSAQGERRIPVSEFFTGYRQTALAAGELIASVHIPRPTPRIQRFYKASKRTLDDISTVAAAFALDLTSEGNVESLRIAYGGIAATPLRATAVEQLALGKAWNRATLARLLAELAHVGTPLADFRGSAEYRRALIGRLFEKFFAETSEPRGGGRMTPAVGKALSHEAARGHVTGSAKYVDDLGPSLANLVHAWPVIAPHAHAKVLAIDSSAALREPGVLTQLTAADVPGVNDTGPSRRDEPLFPDEVVFHGQAVAWVLADSEEEARCGAAQVSVTYEPLPAILSIEQAIAAQSFLAEPEFMRRGDPERALEAAPLRLQGELFIGGQEHFYLETQAALAWYDEGDSLFVQSSTQHPTETQEIVARVMGVPKSVVVVQCLRMGGAFGGKETASQRVGGDRSARHTQAEASRARTADTRSRHDDDRQAPPFFGALRCRRERDGQTARARRAVVEADGGCSLDLSSPVLARAMFHVDNCYLLPNVKVVGRACRTNMVSHTAFRGFGGPQGMLVIEEILARVAGRLGLAPHVVRARNFYAAGDDTHYGQPVRDADRILRIWSELQTSSRYEARTQEIARFNADNADNKRGLAITPVKFGISFTASFYNQAGALVLIYKDGSVQVNHGGTEMGQGLHTKMLQIAADALGVALESVRIMPTRTDKVPNTSATAASSGSAIRMVQRCAMPATRCASRLAEVAARRFQTHPEDIAFADGRAFCLHDESLSLTFAELVSQAYQQRVALSATGLLPHAATSTTTARPAAANRFSYYAYGAAVSEVEVDAFTGQYRLLRVDILHDVGDSLSPLIDRGQIEGGFMQGVGWLTSEELVWNAASGALATAGASTYKLPSLGECPPILEVALLTRAAEPGVVHGSKAVGEPPFMLAFSVREALRAAIAAFGAGGITELASPATPEAVFWAIERVQRRAQRSRSDRNAAE